MTSAAHNHDRYILLDELRGIAAFAVLVFHVGTRAGGPHLFYNGYLAVDFFFMLSGFVIAVAYEKRLAGGMTFGDFTLKRLVRMLPVASLGVLIGFAYFVARFIIAPDRSDDLSTTVFSAALNFFMIPKWWYGDVSRWELFPVNGPLWSLFFEILINLAWAALLVGRRTSVLVAIVVLSGLLVIVLAQRHGTMDMGWEITSFDGGVARVTFGFTVGLLLHRVCPYLPRLGSWAAWLAIVLLLIGLMAPSEDAIWTTFVAVVVLPIVMVFALAAGRHRVLPGGTFLGAISYPLYGVHSPLLSIYSGGLETVTGASSLGWWSLLVVPPVLLFSWLVMTYYETPVRALLQQRLRRQAPALERASG